jgi:hypothetical protein
MFRKNTSRLSSGENTTIHLNFVIYNGILYQEWEICLYLLERRLGLFLSDLRPERLVKNSVIKELLKSYQSSQSLEVLHRSTRVGLLKFYVIGPLKSSGNSYLLQQSATLHFVFIGFV